MTSVILKCSEGFLRLAPSMWDDGITITLSDLPSVPDDEKAKPSQHTKKLSLFKR